MRKAAYPEAGPYHFPLESNEWAHWPRLRMRLTVNGELRQDAYCGDMLHDPDRTLTELSGVQDLFVGDLIATGAPAGCAATALDKAAMPSSHHMPAGRSKWLFHTKQGMRNGGFLKPSDLLEACIRADDGQLDLGTLLNRLVVADSQTNLSRSLT
jgi:2,4-didehydro-3-deoxy-L-rhamnonate hydrolase